MWFVLFSINTTIALNFFQNHLLHWFTKLSYCDRFILKNRKCQNKSWKTTFVTFLHFSASRFIETTNMISDYFTFYLNMNFFLPSRTISPRSYVKVSFRFCVSFKFNQGESQAQSGKRFRWFRADVERTRWKNSVTFTLAAAVSLEVPRRRGKKGGN